MTYTELVKSVLASMKARADKQPLIESFDDVLASKLDFFKQTSESISFEYNSTEAYSDIAYIIRNRLEALIDDNMARSVIRELNVLSWDKLQKTGIFSISVEWGYYINVNKYTTKKVELEEEEEEEETLSIIEFEHQHYANFTTTTITKPMKISKFIRMVVEDLFIKGLDDYLTKQDKFVPLYENGEWLDSFFKQYIERSIQGCTKDCVNAVNALFRSVYIYFTDKHIAEHYRSIHETQDCGSCMSYKADVFGNTYKGAYIHPLDCYEYSDDFVLGLVSYYTPEQLQEMVAKGNCDYPFVGRFMAFRAKAQNDTKTRVSYARYYGDEAVSDVVSRMFKRDTTPVNKEFYALLADGLSPQKTSPSSIELQGIYRNYNEDVAGHFIAPYVDCYMNRYIAVNNDVYGNPIIEDLPNGMRGILLKTTPSDRVDYSIYYKNSILFVVDVDCGIPEYQPELLIIDGNGRMNVTTLEEL